MTACIPMLLSPMPVSLSRARQKTISPLKSMQKEITGPNSTTDETCSFNASNNVPSFSQPASNLSLITQYSSSLDITNASIQDNVYDEAVTLVYPIFTVLFPPANDSNRGGGSVTIAEAFLTCARPVNITAGSRVPAALPAPTELRKITNPLSPSAKAGIAVGVVGAFLIGGLATWKFISERKKSKVVEDAAALGLVEKKMRDETEAQAEKKTPMLGSEERYEAEGGMRPEMDGAKVFMELEGSGACKLDGRIVGKAG